MSKQVANIGTGPFDRALVDLFARNLSPEEVSASEPINGILTPAQCLSRIKKIIGSKDALDHADRLALLLDDAYWLRNKLKKQMDKVDFIAPDQAAAWMKTLGMIVDRVEAANLGMSEQMLRFNEKRADEFIQSLTAIVTTLLQILGDRHPEIEQAEVTEIVLEAIPSAIPAVET